MENILGWLQFNESLDKNNNSKLNEGAIHKFADNVYRRVMDYLETNVIPEGDWENKYFGDGFYNSILKKAFDCYDAGNTEEESCTQQILKDILSGQTSDEESDEPEE